MTELSINQDIGESYSFEWKSFLLVESIPLSESHFLYWKPFLSVEAILFGGYYYF